MSEPLATWLQLREAADWRSRSGALASMVADAVRTDGPCRIVDLATGTGSNVRYLMDRIGGEQHWLIVDRNPDLLALVHERSTAWARERGYALATREGGLHVAGSSFSARIDTRQLDLADPGAVDLFDDRHLVTASALLDLVSPSWLRTMAAQCRRAGAAALFALTYDGRSACEPSEPEDELVRNLLNRHQESDKGLGGPAAGPAAAHLSAACFADEGFRVETERTDWNIGPDARAFQRDLIDGWYEAAVELDPSLTPVLADWRARRLAHLDEGRSRITVGHHDVAALPKGPARSDGASAPSTP